MDRSHGRINALELFKSYLNIIFTLFFFFFIICLVSLVRLVDLNPPMLIELVVLVELHL